MNTNHKPVHGTGEWAASNTNIQNGCEHDCAYCYAKAMAIRFHRSTPEGWKTPRIRYADVNRRYTLRTGRIMFPSSHDITPRNIDECVSVLKAMLEAGNSVLIVSKPHPDCIRHLCRELVTYRENILFRFTIGSADDSVLKYWEPGAPSLSQRVEALKHAHAQGFATSVSCEPMLDGNVAAVIAAEAAQLRPSKNSRPDYDGYTEELGQMPSGEYVDRSYLDDPDLEPDEFGNPPPQPDRLVVRRLRGSFLWVAPGVASVWLTHQNAMDGIHERMSPGAIRQVMEYVLRFRSQLR